MSWSRIRKVELINIPNYLLKLLIVLLLLIAFAHQLHFIIIFLHQPTFTFVLKVLVLLYFRMKIYVENEI